ncbi:FKBP-type peptidyl-prolyl cis-trans isomerase [Flavihumibacter solisilvae]|uniref:FKBP-type peptidyl-prolyl cis-trans isomerase n=1 Tax=Flavihumibacter solisilvae TaxID=1349421 RepID=UPI00068CEE3D|nr:FKBP-type peptidyl-prolyl cis-trans isomerase [Flavihumibacter solisilvae]
MKKFLVFFCITLISVGTWQCVKSEDNTCTPVPPQNEDAAMLQYISSHNIDATKDPSGLYYQIIDTGYGASPQQTSRIAVKYAGYLTDGTKFDELTQVAPEPSNWWALGGLIHGWQIGLPKIKKGGKIKMVIPSGLAYGCTKVGNIPANSILVFDVELVDFN